MVQRPEMEVRAITGFQAEMAPGAAPVFILDRQTPVSNPGFDITPSRLITGIVTEHGLIAPAQLAAALASYHAFGKQTC